jgi:hypothetical protein
VLSDITLKLYVDKKSSGVDKYLLEVVKLPVEFRLSNGRSIIEKILCSAFLIKLSMLALNVVPESSTKSWIAVFNVVYV